MPPATMGDCLRREKTPTISASIVSTTASTGAKDASRRAKLLTPADSAPRSGPYRMAIGSVSTRPIIGVADPATKELTANPPTPASAARARRRYGTRIMRRRDPAVVFSADRRGGCRPRAGRLAGVGEL